MKPKQITALILAVLLLVGGDCGYRFIKHEKAQNEKISSINSQVAELSERIERSQNYYLYDVNYGEGFNWLALGNSLTLIKEWGRGICSTQPNNDYFGLVKTQLETTYGKVNAYRYNYCVWEMSPNRGSTLDLIDDFLSPNLDLVTIQLGENCNDISTYGDDLSSLVDYIRAVSPKVQVVIVDDFWDEQRAGIRQQVADVKKCEFANLGNIRNNRSFQSDAGILCYMTDGSHIEVPKEAATHPGDKGMEYIAKEIINCIK